MAYPTVRIVDETMRDGIQIEAPTISTETKIGLIDILSGTGLTELAIGYFASPRYSPSMADVDAVISGITPREGVTYTAGAPNAKGRERRAAHVPPLTISAGLLGRPVLQFRMSDTFHRRNNNESHSAQIDRWPAMVARAAEAGASEGAIALGAVWGCNFEGPYSDNRRFTMMARMIGLWEAAGIPVTTVGLSDPMSWGMPHVVERNLRRIVSEWPQIGHFQMHIHNARGSGLAQVYAALRALDERHELVLDATCGGLGGCPYCGNGRAAGMVPTEDLVVMLEEMGIPTGVDLEKLVHFCWELENAVGHRLYGHVSQAGWLPRSSVELYDENLPFVETHDQARHFLTGPSVLASQLQPWREPIPPAKTTFGTEA